MKIQTRQRIEAFQELSWLQWNGNIFCLHFLCCWRAYVRKNLLAVTCITLVLFPDTAVQRGSGPPGNTGLREMEPYVKKWAFFFSFVCLLCCFCSWPLLLTPVPHWMLLFFFLFQLMESPVSMPSFQVSVLCFEERGKYTISSYEDGFPPPFLVCIMQTTSLSMVSHQCSFTLIISWNCVFSHKKHKDIQVTFSVYDLIIFINVC